MLDSIRIDFMRFGSGVDIASPFSDMVITQVLSSDCCDIIECCNKAEIMKGNEKALHSYNCVRKPVLYDSQLAHSCS